MSTNRPLVVVCSKDGLCSELRQMLDDSGYGVRRFDSFEAIRGAGSEQSSVAAVVELDGESLEPDALRSVLSQADEWRALVCMHNTTLPSEMNTHEDSRVLVIRGAAMCDGDLARVRRFLEKRSYAWASELTQAKPWNMLLQRNGRNGGDNAPSEAIYADWAEDWTGDNTDEMLEKALQRYMRFVNCEAGSIYVANILQGTLTLTAASGPDREDRLGIRQRIGEGLAGWVAEVGEPMLVTDIREVPRIREYALERYSSFSCLAVPVKGGGQLLGVVCLTMPRGRDCFSSHDLTAASALAEKLGTMMAPANVMTELHSLNFKLNEFCRTYSGLMEKRQGEVESLRTLSTNILDSIDTGVIAYDCSLQIQYINASAEEICGVRGAAEGSTPEDPLMEGLRPHQGVWRDRLVGVVRNKEAFSMERQHFHRGDATCLLDVRCTPLYDSSADVAGVIVSLHDVTEAVEIEARLAMSERMALVGRFAAKVAHELNNPLDGIVRFVNLAKRQIEAAPEAAKEYLDESTRGLSRMSTLLRQLLSFSHGRLRDEKPVSLSRTLRDAVALYQGRAEALNIDIVTDFPSELPPGNSAELCGVFGNLIKNALDAMGEDGTLVVEAAHNNGYVEVTVSDTGPGVPKEIAEDIFEPFFSTKNAGDGMGLGLAWVRELLERTGGSIRLLDSEKGAVFEVKVPVVAEESEGRNA